MIPRQVQAKTKMPVVVIVGRINVGKSSLFNRLTETSKALVSTVPGTTRDYNRGEVFWRNKKFELIDTGGVNIDILKHSIELLLPQKKILKHQAANLIETEIIKQTKNALKKADLLLLVTDGQAGLMAEDNKLALVAKKLKIPVLPAVNKIDSQKWASQLHDFFKLGLGRPQPVSAANGSGSGDLLDEIIKKLKWPKGRAKKTESFKPVKVAIIGKPNVGKSSLVNQILGEERVIVSPIPQTTREPQDTEIIYQGHKIILIDTAGLAKKAKIQPGLDKQASKRSLAMINAADIIIFVTEADKMLTTQDSHLAGLIKDSGAGIIMVANKWDLIADKTPKADVTVKKYYQGHFPYLGYAPLIFISALTGRSVDKILDLVLEVNGQREKEIPQDALAEFIKKAVRSHYPAQATGTKRPHIHHFTQTKTSPPLFTITLGKGQSLHFSYLRFLENQLRQKFGFLGTRINIHTVNLKH